MDLITHKPLLPNFLKLLFKQIGYFKLMLKFVILYPPSLVFCRHHKKLFTNYLKLVRCATTTKRRTEKCGVEVGVQRSAFR